MATIKDIASVAGVSQGTVSNVLNGKGNVSSEKILLVEKAASQLGYTINRRAKLLRKGSSNLLGVVLPNIYNRQYTDFFLSFKHYAEAKDYAVYLCLSDDNVEKEKTLVETIRSEMATGIVAFTSQDNDAIDIYASAGFTKNEVVFVERMNRSYSFIGFDYAKAGWDLAQLTLTHSYKHVALVTENLHNSAQEQFFEHYTANVSGVNCQVHHIITNAQHCNSHFLQALGDLPSLEAVFLSNFEFAETFRNIKNMYFKDISIDIYTLSPLFTLLTTEFQRYELNYRFLGRTAAECLIEQIRSGKTMKSIILPNDGLRKQAYELPAVSTDKKLTVLTLDSPTAYIIEKLSRQYTENTKIDVKVSISSYDGIHEILNNLNEVSSFDVIRLDHTWLSWFEEKIFTPLIDLDPHIGQIFDTFIPGLHPKYTGKNDKIYALPATPSAQLLFYRKDLFENPTLQRIFKEKYKKELTLPTDFQSFNRIAHFFTRRFNMLSPVEFGTTLTMGNTDVAASEFLTRYFSHTDSLFNEEGNLFADDNAAKIAIDNLIEAKMYSPKRYSSWWSETANSFAEGNIAMIVLFSNHASEMMGIDSKVIGKIGYTMVPGGNPLLGGASIGVCKNSKNKKEALSFIKWVCSEEVTSAMTFLGSVSPCKKTYDNYEIMDTFPWLQLSKKCITISQTNRIPKNHHKGFDERRFLSILGVTVHNAYSKSMTTDEALEYAKTVYRTNFE